MIFLSCAEEIFILIVLKEDNSISYNIAQLGLLLFKITNSLSEQFKLIAAKRHSSSVF